MDFQVSEFAPPQHQKLLSYVVGQPPPALLTLSITYQNLRLALRSRVASFPRQRLLYARNNHPRLDCFEQRGIPIPPLAWHTPLDSGYRICHCFQHLAGCEASTDRGNRPDSPFMRLFRYYYSTLDYGSTWKSAYCFTPV